MTEPRAAGYTRVSTQEQAEGRSLTEQDHLIGAHCHDNGLDLIEVFSDPGYSGAREDRPGLQEMLARLEDFDVIVVWAMDRLTRDVELFAKLVKRLVAADVRVESLTAHVDLTTPEGEAMAGVSAVFGQFERKRIGERVRNVLAARAREGLSLGGPPPDGWMDRPTGVLNGRGNPINERVHDPERAPVIRRLFALAAEGVPDGALGRRLNVEGHRTASGRPWDRRSVQDKVTNAWYAGRVMLHRGKPEQHVFEGQHEPLADPAVFDVIQQMRAARDLAAPEQKVRGRPARKHALARLAVCGHCGERLFAVTSSYKRKDGSKARSYQCRNYKTSTGLCDATFDAEIVDATVVAELDTLLVDIGGWRERLEDSHSAERDRLAVEVERAQADHNRQLHKAGRVEGKWSEYLATGRDADADLVLPMVERERQTSTATERRLIAAQDALASVPTEAPTDAMLDFASALQDAIRGRVDQAGTMGEVNQALREMFACFTIHRSGEGHGPFEGILIQPWLLPGVLAPPSDPELGWAWPKLVKAADEPPPLRWLQPDPDPRPDPEQNARNPQA
jgi:DNA invertase Pin-like site-specific DNA recombinase